MYNAGIGENKSYVISCFNIDLYFPKFHISLKLGVTVWEVLVLRQCASVFRRSDNIFLHLCAAWSTGGWGPWAAETEGRGLAREGGSCPRVSALPTQGPLVHS